MQDVLWKYLGVLGDGRPRTTFLDDQLFRFTPPHSLNDIAELKPRILMDQFSDDDLRMARKQAAKAFSGGVSASDDLNAQLFLRPFPRGRYDEKHFPGLWPATIPELRSEPFATVAELDAFKADQVRQHVESTLNANIGVFSLSTSPDTSLMWMHYASGHRGIVVGLDAQVLSRMRGVLLPVEYSLDRVPISSVEGSIRVAGQRFQEAGPLPAATLLRKHPDCEFEKEVRLLAPLKAAHQVFKDSTTADFVHLFKLPETAIRCLILGQRVSQPQEDAIISQLRAHIRWKDVHLKRATLGESDYGVHFEDVPWRDS